MYTEVSDKRMAKTGRSDAYAFAQPHRCTADRQRYLSMGDECHCIHGGSVAASIRRVVSQPPRLHVQSCICVKQVGCFPHHLSPFHENHFDLCASSWRLQKWRCKRQVRRESVCRPPTPQAAHLQLGSTTSNSSQSQHRILQDAPPNTSSSERIH